MRLARPARPWVVAIAAATVGTLLGACGGGSTSPRDFARQVCGAVGGWQQDILRRTEQLTSELGTNASPQEGRGALADYFDGLIADTDEVIERIDSAGVPDVERGQEASDRLQEAFSRVKSSLESARERVDRLPTDDPQAFQEAAADLGNSIQSSMADVGEFAQKLEAPELDQAFESEQACSDLQ